LAVSRKIYETCGKTGEIGNELSPCGVIYRQFTVGFETYGIEVLAIWADGRPSE
jgi:hypothetical protein